MTFPSLFSKILSYKTEITPRDLRTESTALLILAVKIAWFLQKTFHYQNPEDHPLSAVIGEKSITYLQKADTENPKKGLISKAYDKAVEFYNETQETAQILNKIISENPLIICCDYNCMYGGDIKVALEDYKGEELVLLISIDCMKRLEDILQERRYF